MPTASANRRAAVGRLDREPERALARAASARLEGAPSERERREAVVPDTGEPKIVQQVRGQFASWAAVSLGLLRHQRRHRHSTRRWFLFPTFGMGIGLLTNYAKLWQSGYSWRDVLTRPPAADAIETLMTKGARLPRRLPQPTAEEFGALSAPGPPGARATGSPSAS